MNSIIITKKSIIHLALCLFTVLTLTSCSSTASRDPATVDQVNAVEQRDEHTPQKIYGERFSRDNN